MCIEHTVENEDEDVDVFETITQQHKSFIYTVKQQRRNKNFILKIWDRIYDFFDELIQEGCLFVFLLALMLVSAVAMVAVHILCI